MTTTRQYWVDTLIKITSPVLSAMAEGKLKETMPVESKTPDRPTVTHLEALGRTLTGLAPWLETPATDPREEEARVRMAELARAAIANAVDPASPDYCNFTDKPTDQPVVDAAFLAHSIVRAPHELWEKLDGRAQQNLIAAFKQTREILAYRSNWLLFPAMVETALYVMTGNCDRMRADYALCTHEQWYKGDGVYGDGPNFAWDYYNSYVIQPMLLDVIYTLHPILNRGGYADRMKAKTLKHARRYAAIQERLIAPDGTFPIIGRSIAYRTGAFQTLAQIALMDQLPDGISPAQVRCALTAVIKRCFEAKETFDENGWLTIGLCGHQPSLGEPYISTGSLYLCTAGFLPLGLPAEHPFWSSEDALYTSQKIWSGIDMPFDHADH
ncbi:MAG: DUF2264 domain-containing protein [Clostridia bacterium]|nr:DUF2264 domain-containing protein [Clostridia bacterium]